MINRYLLHLGVYPTLEASRLRSATLLFVPSMTTNNFLSGTSWHACAVMLQFQFLRALIQSSALALSTSIIALEFQIDLLLMGEENNDS